MIESVSVYKKLQLTLKEREQGILSVPLHITAYVKHTLFLLKILKLELSLTACYCRWFYFWNNIYKFIDYFILPFRPLEMLSCAMHCRNDNFLGQHICDFTRIYFVIILYSNPVSSLKLWGCNFMWLFLRRDDVHFVLSIYADVSCILDTTSISPQLCHSSLTKNDMHPGNSLDPNNILKWSLLVYFLIDCRLGDEHHSIAWYKKCSCFGKIICILYSDSIFPFAEAFLANNGLAVSTNAINNTFAMRSGKIFPGEALWVFFT